MYNGKLTQTEVLELGFTKSMIDKLLPDPELKKIRCTVVDTLLSCGKRKMFYP